MAGLAVPLPAKFGQFRSAPFPHHCGAEQVERNRLAKHCRTMPHSMPTCSQTPQQSPRQMRAWQRPPAHLRRSPPAGIEGTNLQRRVGRRQHISL